MKVDQNVCRLCTKVLSGVFFKTIDSTMRTKIEEILRIETLLKDPYNHICLPCSNSVNTFYNFFVEIQAAQSFFENKEPELLMEIKIEEENGVSVEPVEQNANEVVGDYSIVKEDTLEEGEIAVLPPKRKPCPSFKRKQMLEIKIDYLTDDDDELIEKVTKKDKDYELLKDEVSEPDEPEDSSLDENAEYEEEVGSEKKRKPLNLRAQHTQKVNNFFTFVCQECKTRLHTYILYRKHMQTKHSEKRPTINCCNEAIDTRLPYLLSHYYTHKDPDKLKCKICSVPYNNLIALQQHVKKVHSVYWQQKKAKDSAAPRVPCPECGVLFKKSTLWHHMQLHQERPKMQCDICKNFLVSRTSLVTHMRTQHLPKKSNLDPFLCNICAKSYETRERFMHHMRYAHDSRTAKCPDCDLVLAVDKLRYHRYNVHDTTKVICPTCQKEFQNKAKLKGHRIKVHGDRRFECDICHKKYKTKEKLVDHRSQHFNELRFKCDLCDHMNNDYGNMSKHRKTKHRDVPYPPLGTARKTFEIAKHYLSSTL